MKAEERSTRVEKLNVAVAGLKKGDGAAFRVIYEMTSELAYFTALQIVKNEADAEDVVQESYIAALNRIHTLKNESCFLNWFKQIVANKSRDVLRRHNPMFFSQIGNGEDSSAETEMMQSAETMQILPDDVLEEKEIRHKMTELIAKLSDENRTAVLLFYYDDLSIKEIAESLGVNENTVKSRLFRAKKELAKGLCRQ